MPNEQAYVEILDRIIERQIDLLGPLAITKAKNIPGLQIDDNGKVISISGNPILTVHHLILKYEEVVGRAAIQVCKGAICELKKKYPGLELPPQLQ